MWMYFNSDKAWKQLSEKGFVYTLRGPSKRTNPKVIVDIRRHSRETRFKALRTFVREVIPNVTPFENEWIENSGFSLEREWLKEAERLSGIQPYWRLFLVEKVK